MQLGNVFNAFGAWQRLSAMRMRPAMAYAILKYTKLVAAEYEVAEKQRVKLIRELTKTNEGEDARIEPNTSEFQDYIFEFNAILQTESDLQPLDATLDEVMDLLGPDQDSSLSVQDLALLEPFFKKQVEQSAEFPAVAGKIG